MEVLNAHWWPCLFCHKQLVWTPVQFLFFIVQFEASATLSTANMALPWETTIVPGLQQSYQCLFNLYLNRRVKQKQSQQSLIRNLREVFRQLNLFLFAKTKLINFWQLSFLWLWFFVIKSRRHQNHNSVQIWDSNMTSALSFTRFKITI